MRCLRPNLSKEKRNRFHDSKQPAQPPRPWEQAPRSCVLLETASPPAESWSCPAGLGATWHTSVRWGPAGLAARASPLGPQPPSTQQVRASCEDGGPDRRQHKAGTVRRKERSRLLVSSPHRRPETRAAASGNRHEVSSLLQTTGSPSLEGTIEGEQDTW